MDTAPRGEWAWGCPVPSASWTSSTFAPRRELAPRLSAGNGAPNAIDVLPFSQGPVEPDDRPSGSSFFQHLSFAVAGCPSQLASKCRTTASIPPWHGRCAARSCGQISDVLEKVGDVERLEQVIIRARRAALLEVGSL